jgi:hypothetical protein
MMAKTFRTRSVVVEAIQYTAENVEEICEWLPFQLIMSPEDGLSIPPEEGWMNGALGDWIIKGPQGEFYACKPDAFAATYEEA